MRAVDPRAASPSDAGPVPGRAEEAGAAAGVTVGTAAPVAASAPDAP